jgi:kynureninase
MTLLTRAIFESFDRADPLRSFRDKFAMPQGVIYLDGNSLGALPRASSARLQRVVETEWGQDLIQSWNKNAWMDLQLRVGEKIGALIGAQPGETIVADSTSVNLFKALGAALRLNANRRVILTETGNFPTDIYIAEGLVEFLGGSHELRLVEADQIEALIDTDVATLMLTHVDYRTGRMWDMRRVTALARSAGVVTIWDLSHSAGAVPVDLDDAGPDFAVGCGYKYLNGGPGAPAFLYVAKRHIGHLAMPLTGWLGHAKPFAFETHFRPADGIARARVGTPPILSLVPLEVGVDIVADATIAALRAKSVRQTDLLMAIVAQELREFGVETVSPADATLRGSQVCLHHPQAWPITQALIARGIIGDFRAPNILRLGIAPLYIGFSELWDAVAAIKEIMSSGSWNQPEFQATPGYVT